MAEGTIPGPVIPTQESTKIEVQNNVTGIESNKNDFSASKINAYSGTVAVKCLINGFCPMYRKFTIDNSIVLNHETLKSLSENDKRNFNAVPGLPGIYLKERYSYLSNFMEVAGKELTYPQSTQTRTPPTYKYYQTFEAIKSVFDSSDQGPIDAKLQNFPADIHKRACWTYIRHNEPVNNISQNKSIKANTDELSDSNVYYVASPSANVDETKGIHWRAKKKAPLYQGEDFFISFRKVAVATDTVNIKSTTFIDKNYTGLDAVYSYNASEAEWEEIIPWTDPNDAAGSGPSPSDNYTSQPKNAAIVGYTETIVEDQVIYTKDEETMEFFNFNTQAYYVIELQRNGVGDGLFIVITQKAYPTAIKLNSSGSLPAFGGVSQASDNLGSYKGIKGADLINMPKWTIQVRHHLGKIVVAFNGNTEDPWIIDYHEPIQHKLSIWGGNIASSFCFSPLTYMGNAQLNLSSTDDFFLPLKETKTAHCTIADVENNIVEEEKREAVYSSDTHFGNGINFAISGTSAVAEKVKSPTTFFATTKRYLKETANGYVDFEPGDISQNCVIDLEAFSIKSRQNGEMFSFDLRATLQAGSHNITQDTSGDNNIFTNPNAAQETMQNSANAATQGTQQNVILANCKTPIISQIRLVAEPNPEAEAWGTDDPLDVTDLVMKYTENYSSSDFHSMTHTATITFLMNKTMSTFNTLVDQLDGLRNRAFYIEIWGGYLTCNYSKLEENKGYKLFTGICYGGVLEEKAGERTLTCQIIDYSQILKESYIFNSPFFDGMRDINAVYTLLRMLGFKDKVKDDNYGPAYLSALQAGSTEPIFQSETLDGRGSFSSAYVLPSSYARLTNPFFKFQDGTTYWSALESICKKAGKIMFFDSYGMFHFENLPYDQFLYGSADESLVTPLWEYTTLNTGEGQMVFEAITRERAVTDIFNIIHLMTATPDRELYISDKVNWPSLYDKNSPGFLGYKKMFMQQDGIFGSLDTLEKLSAHYESKFFNAPTVYKFSSYGLPMRCFDVVSVNGQKLIVTSVANDFDPKKNLWWQNVEGEWYGSEEDFGEE